jgi:hypothetical protein
VQTGVSTFVINKSPLSIITPAGQLVARFIDELGAVTNSFDIPGATIAVEESGPMRAIIKIDVPAFMTGVAPNERVRHGWAIRLYAYAGKAHLKVDYQLQNSPKNKTFGRPMFFDSLSLEIATGVSSTPQDVRAQDVAVDAATLIPGVVSNSVVCATIRHFHEKWPNGLSIDALGNLSVQLFPAWAAKRNGTTQSTSGLHWLNDMQHVVKEVMLSFEQISDATAWAQTVRWPPVAMLPTSHYAATQVSLDMGGAFPTTTKTSTQDIRQPNYANYNRGNQYTWAQRFGWDTFGVELDRKLDPRQAGNIPWTSTEPYMTENPADYFLADDRAMGELNVRGCWISQYTYANDYALIQPTENPYDGWSWRKFDGSFGYSQAPGYIAGTAQDAKPRDDQHGWFYFVSESYWITGNPWVKDWYQFVGQFRRTRLNQNDPYPDMSGRATGHALSHALDAYRITGDTEILTLVGNYIKNFVAPLIDPVLGGFKPRPDAPGEAMFQIGYLSHAMITYLEELQTVDSAVYNILAGFVKWNMTNSNFGYYNPLTTVNQNSDGTSVTFMDAQAYYATKSNDVTAMQHLDTYAKTGIGPAGQRPYFWSEVWTGIFCGRIATTALKKFNGG